MEAVDTVLYGKLETIRNSLNDYLSNYFINISGELIKSVPDLVSMRKGIQSTEECTDTKEVKIPQFLRKKAIQNLDVILNEKEESFSVMLLRLIDEKGLKDSDVYKKANIDRRLFSKIRGDEDYVPSKKTAISFCLALQLSKEEADILLGTAGYILSASSRFDLIICYLLENREYNIQFANIVLEDYGEGSLSR